MVSVMVSGGPVFWIIMMVAVASTALFLLRFFELRGAHVVYSDFMAGVENLIAKGNDREALAVCGETRVPVARVVEAALRRRGETQVRIREAAEVAARLEMRRFSRRLSVLQSVAQISPLLGLFGTMVGFAQMLVKLAENPLATRKELLVYMGPALACAAAGLLVAVLVHVMYALLRARLEHLTADLDAAVGDMVARLGGDAA